jgi:hypothetical protein
VTEAETVAGLVDLHAFDEELARAAAGLAGRGPVGAVVGDDVGVEDPERAVDALLGEAGEGRRQACRR